MEHRKYALIRVDWGPDGDPKITVLEVFDGPDAETAAHARKSTMLAKELTDPMQTITRVRGDFYLLVRPVGEDDMDDG